MIAAAHTIVFAEDAETARAFFRDIEQTVAELERKGVEFVEPVSDEGFGLITWFKVPGAGTMGLYEPRHPSPLAEFRG